VLLLPIAIGRDGCRGEESVFIAGACEEAGAMFVGCAKCLIGCCCLCRPIILARKGKEGKRAVNYQIASTKIQTNQDDQWRESGVHLNQAYVFVMTYLVNKGPN
jgi:hypothetical protein